MTALHSISNGCAELADEIKKIRRELGGFDYANCECHLAKLLIERGYSRTPALPSGEVERNAIIEECAKTIETPRSHRYHQERRNLANKIRTLASSPTPQIAEDRQVALDTEGNPVYRARDATPPFSRWADIIESASLAISPKGSEALNALAAEVRAFSHIEHTSAGVIDWKMEVERLNRLLGVAQGARVPKVRTSHHRNKEEAARLQELVAKRHEAREKEITRLATIEECAAVCDKHAEWGESKIRDDEPAESTGNQIFALISNTANDCAEMIRDLNGPVVPSTQNSDAAPANRSTAKATAIVGDDRESMEAQPSKVASPEAGSPSLSSTDRGSGA